MADKITLIEFHAHTDGSNFSVKPSVGSGVGELVSGALRSRQGESEDESIVESLTSDDDEIEYGDEFDGADESEDDGEDTDDEDDGAGKGTGLVGILMLVALVLLTRKFLGDDDEDPFEEEFGQ